MKCKCRDEIFFRTPENDRSYMCDGFVSGRPFACAVCVTFTKLTCNGGDVPLCGATYLIFFLNYWTDLD